MIRADPLQVQLTLVDLARNARDAMPSGGTLRIEASNVTIPPGGGDDIAPGSYVLVKITDTGEGMAPETLRRACEPFFTTKEPDRARGLGLAQAQLFLSRSGGALRLNSAAGQGTTVRLYLPRWMEDGETAEVPSSADTILVAEDDEDVRALAVGVLEGLGFSVLAAADGMEALALLRGDKPIRLLFTDILMPGKNGIEVAREARALRPELPILFTSGYASRRLVQETALDPETHILRKPWLPEDLDREIRAALGRPMQ
jgi:CheY-like chemotaxis protein